MNSDSRNDDPNAPPDPLETADTIARAAHLWIRSICLNGTYEEGERQALASGLVTGLCESLDLHPRVRELVAYVYTLQSDERVQALAVSRQMLERSIPPHLRDAYERGRLEAAGIVEMLAFLDERRK